MDTKMDVEILFLIISCIIIVTIIDVIITVI